MFINPINKFHLSAHACIPDSHSLSPLPAAATASAKYILYTSVDGQRQEPRLCTMHTLLYIMDIMVRNILKLRPRVAFKKIGGRLAGLRAKRQPRYFTRKMIKIYWVRAECCRKIEVLFKCSRSAPEYFHLRKKKSYKKAGPGPKPGPNQILGPLPPNAAHE